MRTICCVLLFPLLSVAQTDIQTLLDGTGFTYDRVELADGLPVEFIASEYRPTQKGVIVFLQGSLPYPLFVMNEENMWFALAFPCFSFFDDYQFVILSKPGIAVVEPTSRLNGDHWAINTAGQLREVYQQHNHLDYYVQATHAVIDKVLSTSSFDQVVLIGHSQGATVGAKVAAENSLVSHLIYLSGGPEGRFFQLVREQRELAIAGDKSEESAQLAINELYEKWLKINKDPENRSSIEGDTNKAWSSFSEETKDELLRLEIPLLVAYGTKDGIARTCDLLPLDFIRAGKNNLTLKPYLGYDHNFRTMREDGTQKYLFERVIAESLEWIAATR